MHTIVLSHEFRTWFRAGNYDDPQFIQGFVVEFLILWNAAEGRVFKENFDEENLNAFLRDVTPNPGYSKTANELMQINRGWNEDQQKRELYNHLVKRGNELSEAEFTRPPECKKLKWESRQIRAYLLQDFELPVDDIAHLKFCLLFAFRLRCNLFHGVKPIHDANLQMDSFSLCNHLLTLITPHPAQ